MSKVFKELRKRRQGEQGIQGVGEKGDKGEQGIQGVGEKGDKGEQGIQGDAFVYSDFTTSQLESLVGVQKGEQGIQGNTGDKGEQGIQGDKGDVGDKGEQVSKELEKREIKVQTDDGVGFLNGTTINKFIIQLEMLESEQILQFNHYTQHVIFKWRIILLFGQLIATEHDIKCFKIILTTQLTLIMFMVELFSATVLTNSIERMRIDAETNNAGIEVNNPAEN